MENLMDENKPPALLLHLGRGGWTLHFPRYQWGSGTTIAHSTLSHYGDTWREHLDELAENAIGADTTVIPAGEEIARFAVSGPMVDVDLEPGLVRGWSNTWAWDPAGARDGRDPRFGNAGSLDFVALDVYAAIVERFGGEVFDPRVRALEIRRNELKVEIKSAQHLGRDPQLQLCELADLEEVIA